MLGDVASVMDAFTEVEALRSIFQDELRVERPLHNNEHHTTLDMKVQPFQTGHHSSASIRVKIEIGPNYPSCSPLVTLHQPRGVEESNLKRLDEEIANYLRNNLEMPVLFDVFQLVQSFLENVQCVPSAVCPICLNDFNDHSPSLCTRCDHFMHPQCLASYLNYSKNEIQRELAEWPNDMKHKVDQSLRCPVCRLELCEEDCKAANTESDGKRSPLQTDNDFIFDWDGWRCQLREMAVIQERQRQNGGLIDVEEEKKRNLITEDTVLESHLSLPLDSGATPAAEEGASALSSAERNSSYLGGSKGRRFGAPRGHWRKNLNERDTSSGCKGVLDVGPEKRGGSRSHISSHRRRGRPFTAGCYSTSKPSNSSQRVNSTLTNVDLLGPPPGFSNVPHNDADNVNCDN